MRIRIEDKNSTMRQPNNQTGNERKSSLLDVSEVFKLNFLLDDVMGELQPLDWDLFVKNEASQELRIVTSSLLNMSSLVLSRAGGHYRDLPSLLQCIRASMLVPGITGDLMAINSHAKSSSTPFFWPARLTSRRDNHRPVQHSATASSSFASPSIIQDFKSPITNRVAFYDLSLLWLRELSWFRSSATTTGSKNSSFLVPLADAFLCEPMPYRSAVKEGATHVVILRTRPDPVSHLMDSITNH